MGYIWLNCRRKATKKRVRFEIIREKTEPILSLETCQEFNFIKVLDQDVNLIHQEVTLENIKSNFSDLFDGLGCMK